MKTLFVIHGIDNSTIMAARKKKENISTQLGHTVDTCVYAYPEELKALSYELLGSKIYSLPVTSCIAEAISHSVCSLVNEEQYMSVIVADGSQSEDLAVCIAAELGLKCVTHVTGFHTIQSGVRCSKQIYNGIIDASYQLPHRFVASEKMKTGVGIAVSAEPHEIITMKACKVPDYLLEDTEIEKRPEQVYSPVLIAAGMGIRNKEDLIKVREYAKNNGFTFGVSRPVAMRGWAGINEIIGVSGNIFSPIVTIAIGISGAPAFMAGIEQSEYILAVNSDPDAPISQLSDAVITDEYQAVLPFLFEYLNKWQWKEVN